MELAGKRWLKIRLGKAITWRRQYLRYCREHHKRLSEATPLPDASGDIKGLDKQMLTELPGPETGNGPIKPQAPSFLAPTKASTLIIDNLVAVEDNHSRVSYATSMNETSIPDILRIMPLKKASEGRPQFVCPYCWTIQRQVKENAWRFEGQMSLLFVSDINLVHRKHVLKDIRPYVCTFEDCNLKLFAERHSWFEHEMQDHRCKWRCNFCSRGLDDSDFEVGTNVLFPSSRPTNMECRLSS